MSKRLLPAGNFSYQCSGMQKPVALKPRGLDLDHETSQWHCLLSNINFMEQIMTWQIINFLDVATDQLVTLGKGHRASHFFFLIRKT